MKEQIINHFLNYEFIYIFSFCSLVFLSLSIIIKKEIIKKISMLLFSICFILFLFEFVLSFYMNIFIEPWYWLNFNNNENSDKITIRYEKSYLDNKNIKHKINRDMNSRLVDIQKIIYEVNYSIFENSFRFVKCNKNSRDAYIFLGCSFTFGNGIEDEETLPHCFSKLLDFKYCIKNYSVQGHSSNTMLNILYNNIIDNKKQIKHFFYSLIEDHIYRNFRLSDPSDIKIYRNDKWINQVQPYGKIKYIFARSYIFRKVFLPLIDDYNQEYYEDYMIKSLKEMNKIVEEKYNSKFTVIVWPDKYEDKFLTKLKETNLDLVFLSEKFNSTEEGYIIKYDGHPTAKANKEIAEILYNHIEKEEIK